MYGEDFSGLCETIINNDIIPASTYISQIIFGMDIKFNHNHQWICIHALQYVTHLYETYITCGIPRVNKINGILLASQTMKLDTIIEQNSKIIELLEKIAKK